MRNKKKYGSRRKNIICDPILKNNAMAYDMLSKKSKPSYVIKKTKKRPDIYLEIDSQNVINDIYNLPNKIDLQGDYECGLISFNLSNWKIYPHFVLEIYTSNEKEYFNFSNILLNVKSYLTTQTESINDPFDNKLSEKLNEKNNILLNLFEENLIKNSRLIKKLLHKINILEEKYNLPGSIFKNFSKHIKKLYIKTYIKIVNHKF